MPIPERLSRALSNEFACFYEVSEIPDTWDAWLQELGNHAQASAARIRQWLDSDAAAAELAVYLKEQSSERHGELVRNIEARTRFAWSHQDDDWTALQRILQAIADCLESTPNAHGVREDGQSSPEADDGSL